jgi:hypothetical protein
MSVSSVGSGVSVAAAQAAGRGQSPSQAESAAADRAENAKREYEPKKAEKAPETGTLVDRTV